jgi:putative serine protease PepD
MNQPRWLTGRVTVGWPVAAVVAALALLAGAIGVTAELKLVSIPTGCDAARAAQAVLPTVVRVSTGKISGSGTVVRADGLVLTTASLATAGSEGIQVLLSDGESLSATSWGTDPTTGLGLLKISQNKLPTLLLSPREPVAVGQPLVAIGSSLETTAGVRQTVVTELAAAANSTTTAGLPTQVAPATLTSDPVPPGNIGGPLVTCENRMVAVVVGNTAAGAVAVPASTAQEVLGQLAGAR